MRIDNLPDYQLGDVEEWASLIFARVYRPRSRKNSSGETVEERDLIGYIFVIDLKFGSQAQWKYPGGHKKKAHMCKPGEVPDQTPLDTAVRELAGETGISLPRKAFDYAGKWLHWRKDHWKVLFTADMTEEDVPWMNDHHPENEGEQPKFFTRAELDMAVQDGKFMREHWNKAVEFGLIIPMTRVAA